MTLFMDVHSLGDAVSLDDVAKAHGADLETQDAYGVHYMRYWVSEDEGKIFYPSHGNVASATASPSLSAGPRPRPGSRNATSARVSVKYRIRSSRPISGNVRSRSS
jgi:Protein of unknown function (DUF4242)